MFLSFYKLSVISAKQHRVLLHQIFDRQLASLPPPDNFEANVMHWLRTVIERVLAWSVHKRFACFKVNIMHHAALYYTG